MVLTCAYGHRIKNALNGRIWFLLHFMFLMLFFANLFIFNFPNSASYWTGVMQLYGKDTNMLYISIYKFSGYLSWHGNCAMCRTSWNDRTYQQYIHNVHPKATVLLNDMWDSPVLCTHASLHQLYCVCSRACEIYSQRIWEWAQQFLLF